MKYKLIALDMDGTLLNRNGEISVANLAAIKEATAAGVRVILATGRYIGDVLPFVKQLDLNLPLVINNGSEVWKSPDTLHVRHVIKPSIIEKILVFLEKYGNDVAIRANTVQGKLNQTNWPEDLQSVDWLQFAVITANESNLKEIRDEITSWNQLEVTNSHPTNVEVNPLGINKGTGLNQVCWMLDIKLSETIAVGDSLNDVSMIRTAGLGAAMGNAQEAVKRAADLVVPSNHEDGVAWLIKHYLL